MREILEVVGLAMQGGALTPKACREMLDVVRRAWSGGFTVPEHVEGARLIVLDGIESAYRPTSAGDSPAPERSSRAHALEYQLANELYDVFIEWARASPGERQRLPNPGTVASRVPDGSILSEFIPAADRVVQEHNMARVYAAGLKLMLALEVFRGEHAEYPIRLSKLVPGVLDELPQDPFSPDGSFAYEPRGEASYILYSVGFDGEDNGGVEHPEDRPRVALTPSRSGRGYDYVIREADGSEK